ncbi:MAG TPA: hypothetical protein VG309_08015 [Rhizomicrobium sp.]|nr:hypothetical protein [Rhizomicrobium sp.]
MQKKLGDLLDLAPDRAKEEPWSSLPDGGIIWVKRASRDDIPVMWDINERELRTEHTSIETVRRIHTHNSDSFWCVHRATDNTRRDAHIYGFYGLLPLNETGLERLEAGQFDGIDPDMRLVVESGVRPAALYVWVVVVRKVSRIATWLLANALGAETYGGVPIFATAGTMGGLNTIRGYGFNSTNGEQGLGKLYRIDRPQPVTKSSAA